MDIENNKTTTVDMDIPPVNPPAGKEIVQWNEKLEQAAKEIGEASKGYKLMHIREAQRANRTYNMLMIFGIIMGPLSGVVSGIGAAINEGSDPTLPIVSIVFAMIAGIIVSVVKYGKYDEASNSNKQAAARYTSIESNVRRQLGLYRTDRVPATPYMDWLENTFEEIFLSAPILPPGAYDSYSAVVKKLRLKVPGQYQADITINNNYEKTKGEEITDVTNIEVNVTTIRESPNKSPRDIEEESPNKSPRDIEEKTGNQDMNETNKIKSTGTMSEFIHLNQCSDKMLEYEMRRLMGFTETASS